MTSSLSGKTYWIIGASEGLGRALARALDDLGAHLILSARSEGRLDSLARDLRNARAVPMDVSEAASVTDAIAQVGDMDGLVYSAGLYEPMAAAEWDPDAAAAMCDVNFFGAVRVLGHIVPRFVGKNEGHIVLIGSVAGYRGLPGAIGYGASKAAIMHLAENLLVDLAGTGVRVQLVNPGFIKTRLTDKNEFSMPFIMTPEVAAERAIRAMSRRAFRSDFPAPFSWCFKYGRFLPDPLFRRMFGRQRNT